MTPSRITFDIGSNVYGQPVTLTRSKTSAGGYEWTIHRGAADQRDDESSVSGLTRQQLLDMASAVEKILPLPDFERTKNV